MAKGRFRSCVRQAWRDTVAFLGFPLSFWHLARATILVVAAIVLFWNAPWVDVRSEMSWVVAVLAASGLVFLPTFIIYLLRAPFALERRARVNAESRHQAAVRRYARERRDLNEEATRRITDEQAKAKKQLDGLTEETAELKKQIDKLRGERQEEWRAARIEFEADYENHKRALQPFLTTVQSLLIATGRRQVTSTWNEYLPVPPGVDDDLYYLFEDLWRNGWPRLLDEANLDELKGTFHSIRGFFDRVYDLLEDIPEHAPAYVDRNVKPHQYDALHVVWHLGHAFDAVLYGNQKADKPPSRWDRLWRKWNTGVMIPSDPTIRITPSTPDTEAPPDPVPEGEHP